MIERDSIGIFGRMNAGKSSLMNLLTQQATSLVDETPGTTADTRTALMEMHGLGPVRLFDTAGIDEAGRLGDKKRRKVDAVLKECDLVLLVIDPAAGELAPERRLLEAARARDVQVLVLYNLFRDEDRARIATAEAAMPLLRFHRSHPLRAVDQAARGPLLEFLLDSYRSRRAPRRLIPFARPDRFFVLNVPMDSETPQARLLRPQAMAVEELTRIGAWPVTYRMDLAAGRSPDAAAHEAERRRWRRFLDSLGGGAAAVITDSQAIDLVAPWTPAAIPLTTFSVMMIEHTSGGRLGLFVAGLRALAGLRPGDRVLIAEACNHSRIDEDIGTVQIPRLLAERHPDVVVEHAFGREFVEIEDLAGYRLIVHCGGCMIPPQKLAARVSDLESVGVPLTNYGLLLSWAQGPEVLRRVLAPWGLAGPLPGEPGEPGEEEPLDDEGRKDRDGAP